jgi:hypothetical protein
MANPLWPASLPQDVLVDGYGERFPDGKIRTPMETGPAKQRPRFTATVTPLKVTIELPRADVQTLLEFYRDMLGMGSLPFDWLHPRTLATVTMRFAADPPEPKPLPGAQLWSVALDLEILP